MARPSVDPDAGLYGRSFADVYDEWYDDLDQPDELVDAIVEAGIADRPASSATGVVVLEIGVGTGRLAEPLCLAGCAVVGIDVSANMLAVCSSEVERVQADARNVPLANGVIDVALLGFNTLFNLPNPAAQASCLRETARVISADGWVVVDTVLVDPAAAGVAASWRPRGHSGVVIVTDTRHCVDHATVRGTHIELGPQGVVPRAWQLSVLTLSQLDAMASRCGLSLARRTGAWVGDDDESETGRAISWYRPADSEH